MLNYFYHVAFDAGFETRLTLFGKRNPMTEGISNDKHIAEFGGIPPAGLVVGAIIILYIMVYASQALIEEMNPAASVVESWLQGIARTLK